MELTATQVSSIVNQALAEAHEAAKQALAQHGDRDACGFAWTSISEYAGKKIRANSRVGRALAEAGVRKDYSGAYCLWNPSLLGVQSISILEAGAVAAAEVFKLHGFHASAGSRLD